VPWVDEARKETQKREASRSNVSSKEGQCHTAGFDSVIERTANQMVWRAVVVADPVWETELLPSDIGVGDVLVASRVFSHVWGFVCLAYEALYPLVGQTSLISC
jgi:hypothetical protein